MSRVQTYAGFVKLEHTIFSLPLIFAGTLLNLHRRPSPRLAGLILLAAVGARTLAMGLNRLIDAEIDARTPRTRRRELPRGLMQRSEAWAVIGVAGLLYIASAAAISPICLALSPIPVLLFAIYPYLKRFTSFAHFGLGLAWSMAPVGGWLAASHSLVRIGKMWWLWLFALLWVTGFDIIYATMDEAFDRRAGLHSLPVALGRRKALMVAALLHGLAFLCLTELWRNRLTSLSALLWMAAIGMLLVLEHLSAERYPEFSFFQINAIIGFMVLGAVYTGV